MANINNEYDIVIVGGGAAGLVLANRLSEDPTLQILILEAGINRNTDPKISVPGNVTQPFGDPNYDWKFESVPQAGLDGKVIAQTQGKVLGGSSAINGMSVMYPQSTLYDYWTKLGNKGWDRKTMMPYYTKFRTFHPPSPEVAKNLSIDYVDLKIEGKSGPIQTCIGDWYLRPQKLWIDTWAKMGQKTKEDPITGNAVGAFTCGSYIDPRTGTRSHAGVAYYEPAKGRPNLHLIENALVEKIIFDKSNSSVTATGVQYSVANQSQMVKAKLEVILSAGAFNSPALLELSGVGDPKILNPLGIDVVIPNPNVGENLQDHLMNVFSVEAADPNDSLDALADPQKLQEAVQQYTVNQTGPLASSLNAMGYFPVIGATGVNDAMEIQNLFSKYVENESDKANRTKALQLRYDYLKSIIMDPNEGTSFSSACPADFFGQLSTQGIRSLSMVSEFVYPFSTGSSHIQFADASKAPIIDPKYLSHPIDIELAARHIIQLSIFLSSEPFSAVVKPNGKTFPESGPPKTLDEAKKWARNGSVSGYHPCGTCAMMPKELGGVVDDEMFVYGTKNLRIVDASIFPIIPKGPMISSVYAVAERAADIIKASLNSQWK